MLTKDELLERFRKKMAEIDAEYLSKLSDEGRIRSLQQRGICKERTPEKWKEIGESVSHGMSNMLPEVREKWRSDLSKGVRDDYMERNLSIPSPNVTCEFGAWFVGFYEGDGTVGIYEGITKNGTGITYHPSIEFAQKDADVVEYIASSLPDANLRWCSRKQVDYRHVKWGGQKGVFLF